MAKVHVLHYGTESFEIASSEERPPAILARAFFDATTVVEVEITKRGKVAFVPTPGVPVWVEEVEHVSNVMHRFPA